MGLAVQLAVASWPAASHAPSVLGGLELAKLCGFKPQVHRVSNSTYMLFFVQQYTTLLAQQQHLQIG